MISELTIVDPQIVGGRKVAVNDTNIRNERLHKVLEQIGTLLVFCVECQSNNTASKAVPSDIRKIRQQWEVVKGELEFALAHNDFPHSSHEIAYKIFLLDQKEILKVKNSKMKSVISALWSCAHFMLSCDSANTSGFLDLDDHKLISERIALVDAVLDRWIGQGKAANDTGISLPSYIEIGELTPDIDGDYCVIMEPSADSPDSKFKDTPDTAIPADK